MILTTAIGILVGILGGYFLGITLAKKAEQKRQLIAKERLLN